jgi:hypothetical protein
VPIVSVSWLYIEDNTVKNPECQEPQEDDDHARLMRFAPSDHFSSHGYVKEMPSHMQKCRIAVGQTIQPSTEEDQRGFPLSLERTQEIDQAAATSPAVLVDRV